MAALDLAAVALVAVEADSPEEEWAVAASEVGRFSAEWGTRFESLEAREFGSS